MRCIELSFNLHKAGPGLPGIHIASKSGEFKVVDFTRRALSVLQAFLRIA